MMKNNGKEHDLTDFLLGELEPMEAAAVRTSADADPLIREELRHGAEVQSWLRGGLSPDDEALLPTQRENIRRAAREEKRGGAIAELASHRKKAGWKIPVAIAAGIALGVFALTMIPAPENNVRRKPVGSAPGAAAGNGADELTDLVVVETAVVEKSLPVVTGAIRLDHKLPPPGDVKIIEILESFPLNAKEKVALWKGAALGVEMIPCPWKPSAVLAMISLDRGKAEDDEVIVRYVNEEEAPGAVLLGTEDFPAEIIRLSPGSDQKKAYRVMEIEGGKGGHGLISISVGGEEGPVIPLELDLEKEPSDDSRFAALVCTFGLWLRNERSGYIDGEVVLGMAREVAAGSLVPDRYDFLTLVDQAMKLEDE